MIAVKQTVNNAPDKGMPKIHDQVFWNRARFGKSVIHVVTHSISHSDKTTTLRDFTEICWC